jgi:hypothetical protein
MTSADFDSNIVAARLRGERMKQEPIEAGGGLMSAAEASKVLGISPQELNWPRKQRRLVGIPLEEGGYAYPAFQFCGGRTIEGLTFEPSPFCVNLAGHLSEVHMTGSWGASRY